MTSALRPLIAAGALGAAVVAAGAAQAQFRWPWEPEPPPQNRPFTPQQPQMRPQQGWEPSPQQRANPQQQQQQTRPSQQLQPSRPQREANLPSAPTDRPRAPNVRNPVAEFAGLDKITGRIISFEVRIDETVQFGALQVTPRNCMTRPAAEEQNTAGFIQVDEVTLQNQIRQIFSGWMFASSPGLNAVEHPIYDVWLTACKGTAIVLPQQGPQAGYEGTGPQEQDAPPAPAPNVQRRTGPNAPPAPAPRTPAQPTPQPR